LSPHDGCLCDERGREARPVAIKLGADIVDMEFVVALKWGNNISAAGTCNTTVTLTER